MARIPDEWSLPDQRWYSPRGVASFDGSAFAAPGRAEQALGQLVLYQLQDKDLALMDSLNMEPGAITVTPDGLSVALVQKPVAPR